ncbi:HAMP domain-containing histidine kinase [Pedobacter frigidisoli]|uniref:histidine kinase n=1 Tax=Pedobacter frigidisoli TaxID=2530455 RepID=A0A4R0P5J7_9SPHI|nr:HAMP domain-containing sensor histidine kinase [Pedobacter frigidisoli]TCD12152.1 HAMP domain-containing histidine kinase [Pedobacter frigidisoli]
MKLASKYNRVNLITSLVVLLFTGVIYYVVIHFILTEKLDRDLGVEEDEIKQYVKTYQQLPLPASYLDQQIYYRPLTGNVTETRDFKYTTFYNPKDKEMEPGRSLVTIVFLKNKPYEVNITKSRVESEDLVRIILLITLGVTGILLISLILINRFALTRLWKPFYKILLQMKDFNLTKMNEITYSKSDIDEFNELNESANLMASRVKQDYKDLRNFTDNASHEMMTPLAIINSKLDTLLQNGPFTEEQGIILDDIYKATGRLSRLNQGLLLLTKIENNLVPDIQVIALNELLEEKVRLFKELAENEKITFHLNLAAVKVNMSKYLADVLLNNLLSNAIKYNFKGGQIWIVLDQDSIQISNTGNDGEMDLNLFSRFAKSANSEGMGLGLAITKQICSLYNFSLSYKFETQKHWFSILFKNSDKAKVLHR